MSSSPVFDLDHYAGLNSAREAVVRPLVREIKRSLQLETALDVGCGAGYFCGVLQQEGFRVTGLDGRPENAALAESRNPGVPVFASNVEDIAVCQYGPADVVFCFGLLYHLENPFLAVRNLYALTGRVLMVESMCLPGNYPVMELRDECVTEDQGLRYVAFYPSEPCLAKLLYRAGFARVYRLRGIPEHPAYRNSARQKRSRILLVASKLDLDLPQLDHVLEPSAMANPWGTAWDHFGAPLRRLVRLLTRPWPEKVAAVRRRFSGSV